MLDWTALLSAVGLVLILEGLLPFISPTTSHKVFEAASKLTEKELRVMGLGSIILGLLVLLFNN